MMAARIRNGWWAREPRKACAVPWKLAWMLSGSPTSARAFSIARTAPPRETPEARLKEMVTTGNWPWWLMARGTVVSSTRASAVRGTLPPVAEGIVAAPLTRAGADAPGLADAEEAGEPKGAVATGTPAVEGRR